MKRIIFTLLSVLCFYDISMGQVAVPKNLKVNDDKLTGTITYYTTSFQNWGIKAFIYKKNNAISFTLSITTQGISDWIFADSAIIFDKQTFDKIELNLNNVDRETSLANGVVYCIESGTSNLNKEQMDKLYTILKNAKKVGLRISGKSYVEFSPTKKQITDIISAIEFYNTLTNSEGTSK